MDAIVNTRTRIAFSGVHLPKHPNFHVFDRTTQPTWPLQHKQHRCITASNNPNTQPILPGSLVRQAIGITGAAALVSVAALTLRHQWQKKKQQEQQQQTSDYSPIDGSSITRPSSSPAQPWFLLRGRRGANSLERLVGDIEARQANEAKAQQRMWDQRWALRQHTVAELRRIAQQNNIRGTSRLRKQELIAAIEEAEGLRPSSSLR